MISSRASRLAALTFTRIISRCTELSGESSLTEMTGSNLASWLAICSICSSSSFTRMVILEIVGSSVVPTASESIL